MGAGDSEVFEDAGRGWALIVDGKVKG